MSEKEQSLSEKMECWTEWKGDVFKAEDVKEAVQRLKKLFCECPPYSEFSYTCKFCNGIKHIFGEDLT